MGNVHINGGTIDTLPQIALTADARNGKLTSGTYTLGAGVTSISVPDTSIGFRLYPVTTDVRFAVGEDPAAEGSGALAVGGIAKADQWEQRLLETGTSRTLRIRGTNTATCRVEVF